MGTVGLLSKRVSERTCSRIWLVFGNLGSFRKQGFALGRSSEEAGNLMTRCLDKSWWEARGLDWGGLDKTIQDSLSLSPTMLKLHSRAQVSSWVWGRHFPLRRLSVSRSWAWGQTRSYCVAWSAFREGLDYSAGQYKYVLWPHIQTEIFFFSKSTLKQLFHFPKFFN